MTTKPNFIRPELLTHPHIPKPLQGVNPRNIMTNHQWKKIRNKAREKNNHCCWACGIHKSKMKGKSKWLEGHESYTIDYEKGRVHIKEIVALCPPCHKFIHSGRILIRVRKGEITQKEFYEIINHGLRILKEANLEPMYKYFKDENEQIRIEVVKPLTDKADWKDWRLVYEGKEYPPKFKSFEEWREHYK